MGAALRHGAFLALLLVLPGAAAARQPGAAVQEAAAARASSAGTPVQYRLSFPQPEHRWMQVEIAFTGVPAGVLQLRMSRSSPGRYALHEFAKNVYNVRVTDAAGMPLTVTRPSLHQWDVAGHAGNVRVTYDVFGDRVDGTYLGIDSTHAHINMPAALMWARGLELRSATVRFEPPAGASWRVATQLFPGPDAFTFTAPNLQYLMDSPSEFSGFSLRTFRVPGAPGNPLFRFAAHHQGTDADLDSFAGDVQKVVTEARHVFGEYPAFEGNTYTFIADYLPWANGDAMEHRNSTSLSSPSTIRTNRLGLLGSISHEFFHVWNVERIRPRSLEPFNFEDANVSGELWLAEGFTSYYEALVLRRAGLMSLADYLDNAAGTINTVTLQPGRRIRTAEEMSRFAPFFDAATSIDRSNFDSTFISYYTWGAAIGLALDLALRDRSDGRITLDHFMRALWLKHGKPGGRLPGYVDHPYTMADATNTLADVAGDRAFADDFFTRYIQGHEVSDYSRLLARAGLILRPRFQGAGYAGELRLQDARGMVRVTDHVPLGSPAYAAGLERDDMIVAIGGVAAASASEVERVIRTRRPGDTVPIVFERRGQRVTGNLRLIADPTQELVPAEQAGQSLTPAQRRFRDEWLSSASRNTI
ncbi:MAG TPA: PDZ domain-containing protein [Vicinamibacterales bacterium]